MKKLFAIVAAVVISTTVFAQNDKKAETASPASAVAPAQVKAAHECYMMKDNALMHCIGDKTEAQKTDVKLKDGSTLNAKGEVIKADGTKSMLANGQCIELNGKMADCAKMNSEMKMDKKADDKMMEKKPADAK